MKTHPRILGTVAVAASLVLLTACSSNSAPSGSSSQSANSSKKFDIVSYWTAGSEVKSLDVLINAMKTAVPGVNVVNDAVAGGGGANEKASLATRLAANKPPATWQVLPGGGLLNYVKAGQIADVTQLWKQNGWASKLPSVVTKAQQVDGKFYSVPIDAERGNVIWTNPKVLKASGVDLSTATTIPQFLDDLAKVKVPGGTPVCLGDNQNWSPMILEGFLMAQMGPTAYTDLTKGKVSFDSPDVKTAVKELLRYESMSNSDRTAVTWDQALDNLYHGKCAVNIMGDWGYGQLTSDGAKPGTDFGWTYLPTSTGSGIYDYIGDSFVIPAKNNPASPALSNTWLKQLMKPDVQLNFNKIKGTVPPSSEADVSSLSQYQQEAAKDLKTGTVVLSLSQGLATPPAFTTAYGNAVQVLVGTKNIDQFISTMVAAQKSDL